MNTAEFFDYLTREQIHLFVEGGRLRFNAPADRAPGEEVLAQIRQRRAELIDYLRANSPRPGPADTSEPFPLSRGQEALWFLYEVDPDSLAYNICYAARLGGDPDLAALRDALRDLEARHPLLRARFSAGDGGARQRTVAREPGEPASLSVTDVSGWGRERVERYVDELADRPFDLEAGPVARWHLLTGGAQSPVLVLVVHHIVIDFRSMEILLGDLTRLYRARLGGGAHDPEPTAWSYRDYVNWSRAWLDTEEGRAARAYWLEQLGGELPVLDLPTDFERPPHQQFGGATLVSTLSPALTARVRECAREQLVTPYVVLLGALAVLLNRYTGQGELLIGSPMLGRNRKELGDVVGYFVNPVVLRLGLDGDAAGSTVLSRARAVVLDALAHQDYPFSQLVEDLRWQRDPSRSPVFQVGFVYERESGDPVERQGLIEELLRAGQRGAIFDLTLSALERGDTLRLTWEFATALFRPETVGRMAGHFERVLAALVESPDLPVGSLPLVSEAEERQLREWNETRAPYPAERTLADLFAEQAGATPEAAAVECDGVRLSYRELDERANRLARRLQSLGVGPDTPVGIALPRSPELVVAALGVMKAGGACLPLDAELPAERIAYVLAESAPPVLLTTSDAAEKLPASAATVIRLDSDPELLTRGDASAPASRATADSLLYVLYTSGSTGRPKGVGMSHRAVVNLVAWQRRQPGLGRPARTLQFTPLTFDVSFQEIAATLCGGGTLVMIDDERRRDGDELFAFLAARRIERLFLPFVALQHLAESAAARGGLPPTLRDVITAGEQLRITPAIRQSFAGDGGCRLHNHYGPTETHVVTAYTMPESAALWDELPPVGAPVSNVRVHLLDERLRPVPVGVAGELYVAGDALARGYFNRPELTAERFVPDPLSTEPGARLYRTGDLARRRADGQIEYLGRRDNQIKLRGFRVELGEIEAVLSRHEGVREAAVVVFGEGDARRLAAYVAADPARAPQLRRSLDAHLRAHLPGYMIPASVAVLDRLPQTPSGKVDRRALPAPERDAAGEFVDPRTGIEESLAALWSGLLDLPRVSVSADFFSLGGHSLLASRLVARVREGFGVEVPLRSFFAEPTVAGLAKLVEQGKGVPPLAPLAPRPAGEELQLSFGQQRLWFLEQLEGPSAAYNMPAEVALRGPLDAGALRRALRSLVERQAGLRLSFPSRDGQPRARLIEPYDPLSLTDLSALRDDEREAEARRLSLTHAAQPFDLAHGPLLRLHLLRLGHESHRLLFNMHHIVSDGWSLGVLLRELSALYEAELRGEEAALPALDVQYTDYAAWQRDRLRGEAIGREVDYWRRQLDGAPPLLELPADRPRPARRGYRGGLWSRTLDDAVALELRRFNRAHGCTTFMTLLAAFKTVLWRYTGQSDLVVGSPVANRAQASTENLVGFFVNTLALRTRLDPAAGFADLLRDVRRAALDAYAHQDVPFERLVEELRPERSLSHTPIFQVMLTMVNPRDGELRLPGLSVERLPPPQTVAKFDLTLYAEEDAGGALRLTWEYDADLFAPERVARLAGHFEELLRGALAAPSSPLAGLNMLTAEERRQLAAAGEGPRRDTEWECVVGAFEARALATPHRTAVARGGRSLDYRQLDRRANQLARHLRARGVGRGDRVALCLPRDLDMIVAVLGVLKAGAAYLPLDPNYPPARIEFIVKDARASLLVSHSSLEGRLAAADGARAVCWLDREAESIASQSHEALPAQAGPGDLVYVIYTSGTTGQPKGSAVYHRGFANLLQWYARSLNLTDEDGVLLISALGFDLTQKNLFAPLLAGGTLHLPESEEFDPEAIAAAVAAQKITWLNCTPSTFYPLVEPADDGRLARLSSLRWVVLGGEPIQSARLRLWLDSPSCAARVLNTYGPTECTDICAAWAFDGRDAEDPVPLGRPVDNVRLAVLDERQHPAPVGLAGEMWIGGAGLGAGYLDRPDLNAERFVEVEVFGRRERMYRTGDSVRWREGGVLDYLGRGDNQIKLRGFRVELGEIESALLDLPAVREAVVSLHGGNGHQKLVAYYVAPQTTTPDALRAGLRDRLPAHMIPAQLVRLDELPRTPNGKLDRRALSALETESTPAGDAPTTETEARLGELWANLLGVERVGRDADFFSLGGHSLLATQVVARVRDHFGCDLPLRSLFERPTVAGLAALIDAEQGQRLPPLEPEPPGAAPALSFAQQRLCFLDQMDGRTAYNVPAALELLGALDERALSLALRHLVERHEGLRLCFPAPGGQPVARKLAAYDPLTRVDLSGHPRREAEAERLREEHAARPFNLAEGPLFSLHLLALEPRRHWLLFNMHHIITDGWSMDLLIRELAHLYTAYSRGEEPRLAPLPVRYSDYAAWQRRCITGAALQEQLDFWRAQLAGAPERLELPTDFPRPLMLEHRGGEVALALDAGLTDRLRALARRNDSTLFMALLAAFNVLLSRYSGQQDISVGTPVANRSHVQLEGVVGLFLNSLVMRTRLERGASFRELLARVRRTTLAAYAHQDLPFEYLVEQLRPERSLSHNPLFQVMLNLVNTRTEEVRLEGLDVRQLSAPHGLLSKFDLTLSFTENAGGGLDGRLEYNAELFTAETMAFLAECFVTLVGEAVERPEARLSELSVLGPAWRARTASAPRPRPAGEPVSFGRIEQSIPARFAEQVERHPDRVAISSPAATLTYAELDSESRRVAAALCGLPPAPRVGLLLPHDHRMIAGLMGVLQTGRAYVPLDAAHPEERLAYILEDTQVSTVVCARELRPLAEQLVAKASGRVVDLDDLATGPLAELPAVPADAVAYVLYTSGSTGRPKGVVQSHRNVLHFIRQYTENLRITPDDRLLQVASYAFDAGVMDTFGALLNGAALCPVDLKAEGAEGACAWVARAGVTIYHSTPTVFRLLTNALRQTLPSVRLVVLGGEAVVRADAEAFRRHFDPPCLLVNGLGPTESTVTLQHFVDHETPLTRFAVPVGRAVGATDVLLVDADGEPAELFGEIVIRSAHVALGYWRRESASFADDPQSLGRRLYRTGDLGRLLPDGNLEAAGRRDDQIKLRGFRIELGEIEATLREHPAVREAAVTLWSSNGHGTAEAAEPRLVAYVTGEADPAGLRDYARLKLPDYMIPAATVVVQSLPLTASGKLDRRALPPPDFDADPSSSAGATATASAAPLATQTEILLANLWGDLLGAAVEDAGADFFELGGHSLLAMQALSRIRDGFGVELPLYALFEQPVLRDLAAQIDASKRSAALPPLAPQPAGAELQLSFAQQRLWFLAQLEPGAADSYVISAALRLEGELDEAALRSSLLRLTERQSSLRMNFRDEGGRPALTLRAPYDPLSTEDLRALPDEERGRAVAARSDDHARRPFDLERDALLRLSLLRTRDDEHVLLFAVHHIVADGWSLDVMVRELGALYASAVEGRAAKLPPLAIQYADYAAWQRGWLQSEELERQLGYWRAQLAGAPALLELPTDRPRPAALSYRGGHASRTLAPELAARLKTLCRGRDVTLYMTLLAAFQTLLHRYTGQDDIVVGTPVANRGQTQTEQLVGLFANTLALRTSLSGDPTFDELLARVRRAALDAYAHQDVPFEKLVEELKPERSLAHTPIFQVSFALQNGPRQPLALGGVKSDALAVNRGTAKFDLALAASEEAEGLGLAFEYNADLFEPETAARMLEHFETLLAGVADDTTRRVSELPLLTERERQSLLVEWNRTATEYPRDECVHRLFERQVGRAPDAVAVAHGEARLTYAELNARANQLARYLRRRGVGPETAVALCAERSPEMVVGLLAVLKAGGAYVPLDPSYPSERLAFMLEDSRAPVLLTQQSLSGALPACAAEVVRLDADWETIAREDEGDLDRAASADNLAYVIYTSGSTGRPKGVCVTHRAVARLVCNTDYVRLAPDDVVAQASNASFDAATFEIWGALLSGARLAIIAKDDLLDPNALAATLRRENVSTLFVTTALFNLVASEAPSGFATLKHLLFGGEACDPAAARAVLRGGAPERLLHVYGPTESTTFSTWHAVGRVEEQATTIPIGRPISNTRAYALDRSMRPVPVGVAGELYLGGDGLARGYLDAPELTAQKFVPDPFGDPGARLYRTGDLVRRLPGGDIEFVGRADQQVKIRGFRIEPGEIEAALSRHPKVKACAVLAREDAPGERRLVAYVVSTPGATATPSDLREFARTKLPDYMTPSAFVQLDELPLNANGKVDHRALPAPQQSLAASEGAYAAPRSPVEEVLAEIWAGVLRLERVGVNDNFFELGGHSLLATQLVSRLRETFGVELALREVFEQPTVAGLAPAVESRLRAGEGTSAPPVRAFERPDRLPLSFAQQRMWFLHQLEPDSPTYNLHASVQLSGALDAEALSRTFDEIVRRHEVLRTSFPTVEGQPVQRVAEPARLPLPVEDLRGLAEREREAEVERFARAEALEAFDVTRGPLLRARLLRVADEEHVLLVAMHHIVSDGWSMGVFVRELAALYGAHAGGGAARLDELPVQYADYALWQRDWLTGATLDAQLDYWRGRLNDAPPLLELPTDRPRPASRSSRGATHAFALPRDLRDALAELSRREGCTLYMTLLAAFQTLLARYSRQRDILVGTPVANRNRAETEGLIGFFVNTLVLRTDLSGEPTFRELLARVREAALGAYAHQDVPFETLVEELRPERSLAHTPLFQVMFALQNAPVGDIELAGVRARLREQHMGTAKFDLLVNLAEADGGLAGVWEYSTDLFDAETVARMAEHYGALLRAAVAAPDSPAHALPLMGDAERERVLTSWNDTAAEYPADTCVHRLFEERAAAAPGRVALAFEGGQMTYGELNRRANQLARRLRRLGVGRETPAAVCMERGPELIVCLLAVLKAGGAYLPLDPAYPAERLRLMLEDAGAGVLLTQKGTARTLPAHEARVVCVDEDADEIAREEADDFDAGASADNLAYVIYTSGSTGRPKGVCVPHRGVVRLVTNTDYADFSPDQVFLQLAPVSFDASTFEIWGALLNGARLVIHPPGTPSLEELAAVLRGRGVTTLWLTAGLFHLMVEHQLDALRGLRQLLAGGDVLSAAHVRRVTEEVPGCRLVNGYGPTENTTFTCCHGVRAGERFTSGVPIGRPISNTRVYVLDEHLRPVPVGVAGELYAGGDGLARGYLDRPELTAERFVPDPLSTEPGARLYRTGDLCRWRADGTLEFLGRLDSQVKLRGFRIEPGEIESALRREPGVKESLVVVHGEGEHRQLVAYLVGTPAADDLDAIRQSLRAQLPDYMIPAHLVALDELPLNANGKVDRARLPAPPAHGSQLESERLLGVPLTPSEELLAGLWCEALRIESVGRDDNFFELGGHSLLATQLVSRIRTVFNSQLPLQSVFSHPTLREMAAQIDADLHGPVADAPVERIDRDGPLPLSFAQERLWFLSQLEPENPFYNTPFALRLTGGLNKSALRSALQDLVARHEVLRTAFINDGGRPRQVVVERLVVPLAEHDLSGLPAEEREAELLSRARAEAREPFRDLSAPPLVRAALLKLGEDEHALLLTLHHIVTDGWSLAILIREFSHFYNARAAGEDPTLAPLPIQYADFAAWQRRWLTGDALERQLEYWRGQLAGAPPMLSLPADRPRPAVQQFRGASLRFRVDRETRDLLHRTGRAHNATLFMTLLSGFAVLLHRYSGQADVMIGTPIANRQRRELEDLLGFFVNTLALRVDLEGRPSFVRLLERVQQVSLGAYAHQDVPFEKLVDELHPERDLSRSPLFQVMFALQNMPLEVADVSGLKLSPVRVDREAALFDLVLDFWDTADGLVGVLEYNRDLFDRERAARLVRHLETLLRAFAADPDAAIDSVPLPDDEERARLIDFSNGPAVDHPHKQSLALAFESQVEQTPLRVAAVAGGESIDYATLNERANRLAHLLRELGVAPGQPVGVLVPRGLDYLSAVLAVVKAGGAFLPLDTAYPAERLRYMIDDSGSAVMLATAEGLSRLGGDALPPTLREVVLVSDDDPVNAASIAGPRLTRKAAWATRPAANPPVANDARDVLYMLYTSGSTGMPKGTLVRHDGALNHIFAEFRLLKFHPDTAFLQSAPASSDISVWQCLAPLLAGGRVVFADFETMCSPAALFDLIRRESVTLIELVPVVLEGLIAHAAGLPEAERALPRLEWCMVTGEAVSVALVNRCLATWPAVPVVNAYGPTEAADDICQHVITEPLPDAETNVPIGRPVDNLTVSVLDERGQLSPVGVPGEICVSGVGVGAGYWRQPERTAASFVENPHAGHTFGDVLYRTGDLGRWRDDGALEFLGRLDHQIKIRGFRVEPGEIEAALRKHPQVRDALVLDQEDGRGERRLAAYLQVQMGGGDSEELVRQQVGLWKDLHEDSYSDTAALDRDPTFNTVGWDSTYTNEPLPASEMRECVDNAVARILELAPRRLLEIGCGTGLLMYPLVARCERYFGTDLSAVAVEQLKAARARLDLPGLDRAELREQRADDFTGFGEGDFDALALNSVIQYFPSVEYLLDVLRKGVRRCARGGGVFVGDVRSLPLLRSYHTSVQCHKADDSVTRDELLRRIEAHVAREQELAVAPELFNALGRDLPRIGSVLMRPKRGREHNEMTRFRYDVTLRLDSVGDAPPCPADAWHDWRTTRPGEAAIRAHLAGARPARWGLRNVSNARLAAELRMRRWLAEAEPSATASELRRWLAQQPRADALDPESLWRLADELPYRVEIVVEPEGEGGEFAVLFTHRDAPALRAELATDKAGSSQRPWADYANNPLQEKFGGRLIPQLRDFVKSSLPGHMIPSAFVVLDRFPLAPGGKIDRGALPKPTFEAAAAQRVAPRTATERAVQSAWADVLGVDAPGVEDNFFALGGHSLKATQVVSHLQQEGLSLSLRDVFNYPTIGELAAFLDRTQGADAPSPIPATPRAPDYPASHAQRRLWVLSQMGGAAAYHMSDALRLRGPVDTGALAAALASLLERHETLRTSFFETNGELRQRVADSVPPALEVVDLGGEADPVAAARAAALEHARAPFDLGSAPLLRVALLKLGPDDHALLFSMHHIVSDGWSMDVLTREFLLLYGAAAADRPAPLPPLAVQHRDYVAWQQSRLSLVADAQRGYWAEQLRDLPPPLQLPTDFPRPAVKTYNGGAVRLRLPADALELLNESARREGATLFMILAASVKAVLYRYSGETDITVGFPVAGRPHADLENQIGFFINTLLLRDRCDGAQPFASFLRGVRETTLAALEHDDYPFDQLVKDLNPPRDPSRNPLFDVMMVLQNTANVSASLPGVRVEPLGVDYRLAQFDLLWSFAEADDGLHVELKYNSDLFLRETAERMLEHWRTLAAAAVARPETPLGRLPLLKPAERAALIEVADAGPATEAGARPRHASLVSWFEEQAALTPRSVAVTDGERQITYAQLNARANAVAREVRRRLDRLGADGEALVGLCVHRSAELVVGLLGILKAGAAYLPLDPDAPAARLRFILRDSRVPLLVTQRGAAVAPEEDSPEQLFLEDIAGRGDEEAANLGLRIGPERAAYVIYTSGSTGEPKGAVITHENVVRLFTSTRRWFDFRADDVWTLFHSYAFDFSVWELWGALLYGGRLVVVPYLVSRAPDQFYELLSRERVTVLNQTPSAFRQLTWAEDERREPLPLSLRYVVFGGEALDPTWLRPWFERHGDERPRLVNMYGITETTVHVTYRALTRDDAARSASLIGEPIPDLYLYVLDELLEPVPAGVAGELYVGGAGLARGYLFRDELTAERFVEDPFRPGRRLYRTGDRVRRRADGDLEYMGRLDDQLKIRGFRVEAGEITSALRDHPGVREAVVSLRRRDGRDANLVAYYVASNGRVESNDLRRHMLERLPPYMVPLFFVPLPRLPLTVNGKLDQRALPEPEEVFAAAGAGGASAGREPGTPTEAVILNVWRGVLGDESLGADDDVFERGAHSVLAIQARNDLQKSLARDIPVVLLFQHRTAAALAARLDDVGAAPDGGRESEARSRAEQRRAAARRRPPAARPRQEPEP